MYSLSVEKYPGNPMMGRREIVDGKVGPWPSVSQTRFHTFALNASQFCYGRLICNLLPCVNFISGWQVHMGDLQRSIRHCDQGRGFNPELRHQQGMCHQRSGHLMLVPWSCTLLFLWDNTAKLGTVHGSFQYYYVWLVFSIVQKLLTDWLVAPWSSAGRTMWYLWRQ